ncbi:hypothetical protein ACFVVX_21670 [Kitasatospora sp. NPDC058170]
MPGSTVTVSRRVSVSVSVSADVEAEAETRSGRTPADHRAAREAPQAS